MGRAPRTRSRGRRAPGPRRWPGSVATALVALLIVPSLAALAPGASASPTAAPALVREVGAASLATAGTPPAHGSGSFGDGSASCDAVGGVIGPCRATGASVPSLGLAQPGPSGWLATPPVATAPNATRGASMVFDSTLGADVLFGGTVGGVDSAATWVYDAGTWTETSNGTGGPAARTGAALADDPQDAGVLLFGGLSTDPVTGHASARSDTWLYASGAWSRLAVNASSVPPARYGAALAYDPEDQRAVLFGGATPSGGGLDADSWGFANGSWSLLPATSSPSARAGAAFAYDPASGGLILYGGWSSTTLVDSWEFLGDRWSQLAPAGTNPSLANPQLAYSASEASLVLVGSVAGAPDTLGEFVEDQGGWVAVNSSLAPPRLPSPGPPLLASDGGTGLLLYLGGASASCSISTYRGGGDGWQTGLPDYGLAPCGSVGSAVAFDPSDVSVLAFGGALGGAAAPGNATWRYAAGIWTKIAAGSRAVPEARAYAAMAYDPIDGYLVLYGGTAGASACSGGPAGADYLCGDTWSFDAGNWTRLSSGGSGAPPARYGAALVWDDRDACLVLVGGLGRSGITDDTWTFAGGNWTNRTATVAGSPGARAFSAAAYDPGRGAVVVFGGERYEFPYGTVAIASPVAFSNGSWTPIDLPGPAPSARISSSLVYDEALGGDLLLGGSTQAAATASPLDDAWLLTGSGWELTTPSVTSYGPLPTTGSALVALGSPGALMLFGGSQSALTGVDAWLLGPLLAMGPIVSYPAIGEVGSELRLASVPTGGSAFATFAFSGLPAGCSPPSGPAVACVPSVAGTSEVGVEAYDPASRTRASASAAVEIVSALGAPSVTVTPAVIDLGGSLVVRAGARGGVAPLTYAFDGLPAGCVATGNVVELCRPTIAGQYRIDTTITDALGRAQEAASTLTVNRDPLVVGASLSPSVVDAGQGVAIRFTPEFGTAPYTISYDGLPPGCPSANATELDCLPGATGSFDVMVALTDALGVRASYDLPLVVHPLPTVTSLAPSYPESALGTDVRVAANVSGGTAPYTYAYQVQPSACEAVDAPVIDCAPLRPGYYLVVLTVTDARGVSATDETHFLVDPPTAAPQPSPPSVAPNGSLFASPTPSTPAVPFLLAIGCGVAALFLLLRRRRGRRARPRDADEAPFR